MDDGSVPFSSVIPARSKRQAMEWSLVLASQGINAIIDKQETGWVLRVNDLELSEAKLQIAQYRLENRGWRWHGQLPGTGLLFHWGALVWVAAMAAFYYCSVAALPHLKTDGRVDSDAFHHGEWWRLFTAITLHENLPHLLSNLATGFLLLGLAMARFGPGIALLSAFLAGAIGNYASAMLYPGTHYSLGASGMVTAALGLVTVQTFSPPQKGRLAPPLFPRALAAGILILVLIGFSPGTDIVAHAVGFLTGAIFGLGLAWLPSAILHRGALNLLCGAALAGLLCWAWRLAAYP